MTKFDYTTFISSLTKRPGVYRMLDAEGQVLYVGKAKNLKNRVSNYFRATGLDTKTIALVGRIADIEITITASETEALLLEQSLIKEFKPPYNILFRDDKSYPFIFLSSEDKYPRLTFHRGAKTRKGRYFGPFPSSFSVRNSLSILQKFFASDNVRRVFKNRTGLACNIKSTDALVHVVGWSRQRHMQKTLRMQKCFSMVEAQRLLMTMLRKWKQHQQTRF